MASLSTLSLHAASAGLASGVFTAVQLLQSQLEQIAARNPTLGAYWHVAAQSALEAAQRSDARRARGESYFALDGVPLSVKDSIAVAGMPWTGGFGHRRGMVADDDAYVVHRLRKQGAVILGKTALDEASFGTSGVNVHFGDCVHPLRAGFSAGGSSSGAAVSVATGMATYALGTDGMGSARIPAALCGVAGFKPSQSRLSQRGLLPVGRRLGSVGLLARHVADLQLPYHAVAGLDPLDAMSRHTPLRHLEPSHWRLAALPPEQLPGLDAAVGAVYLSALERLRAAVVEPLQFTWSDADLVGHDFTATRRAGLLLLSAELAASCSDALLQQPETFSPGLRKLLDYPSRRSAVDLARADARIDGVVTGMRQLFGGIDVLLLPTTPVAAHPLAQPAPEHMADYTALASLAGLPALSLPCGRTADGLPVGLQLVGPAGSDLLLLLLGARWQDVLAG